MDETRVCDIHTLVQNAVTLGEDCTDALLAPLRTLSLVQLSNELRPFLCDEDSVRPAMFVFAKAAQSREDLTEPQLTLLVTFFAEKLPVKELQGTALACLSLVVTAQGERQPCPSGVFTLLMKTFSEQLTVQNLRLPQRTHCMSLLMYTVQAHNVVGCDAHALRVLLDAMDGEGDPTLVLQIFALHERIYNAAQPAAWAAVMQEYFDSIASYFPVVFSQPPGCAVTKLDLKQALARCLTHRVYSELCIPFLLGKLASPSLWTKQEALETLRACVETYPEETLAPHVHDMVRHVRNEAVKLAAFPAAMSGPASTQPRIDKAATPRQQPTPAASCMTACCTLLRSISAAVPAETVLDVFEPITEGLLTVLGAAELPVIATYATMLFQVLTGSWQSALRVGGYVFSLLAMQLQSGPDTAAQGQRSPRDRDAEVHEHDGGRQDACCLLMAALCSGLLDARVLCPSSSIANDELRAALRPSVSALLFDAVDRLSALLLLRRRVGDADAETNAAAMGLRAVEDERKGDVYVTECVMALLKLAVPLAPWLPSALHETLLKRVLRAASASPDEAAADAMCDLLSGYAAVDASGLTEALREQLCVVADGAEGDTKEGDQSLVQPASGLLVLRRLAASAPHTAHVVLSTALLPSASPPSWLRRVDVAVKARVAEAILETVATTTTTMAFTDDEVETLVRQLTAPIAGGEEECSDSFVYFTCLYRLLCMAAASYRARLVAALDQLPVILAAGLLSALCRPDCCGSERAAFASAPPTPAVCSSLRDNFIALCHIASQDDTATEDGRRLVGVSGLAALMHLTQPTTTTSSDKAAWDMLYAKGGAVALVAGLRGTHGLPLPTHETRHALVARLVQDCTAMASTSVLRAALTSCPVWWSTFATSEDALLTLYLGCASDVRVVQRPSFWLGVQSLLTVEAASVVTKSQQDILTRLCAALTLVTAAERVSFGAVVRATLAALLDRSTTAADVARAIVHREELFALLLGSDVATAPMTERCATLELLTKVARLLRDDTAGGRSNDGEAQRDTKPLLLLPRRRVLDTTLPLLADHKRRVRRAAAECRHEWYKIA